MTYPDTDPVVDPATRPLDTTTGNAADQAAFLRDFITHTLRPQTEDARTNDGSLHTIVTADRYLRALDGLDGLLATLTDGPDGGKDNIFDVVWGEHVVTALGFEKPAETCPCGNLLPEGNDTIYCPACN